MSQAVGKALKNSAWQSLSGLAITGLNFLLMLIYARVLGPEQFGSLITSQSQVLVWALLVDLGLTSGLISSLSHTEGKAEVSSRSLIRAALFLRIAGAFVGTSIVLSFSLKNQETFWQNMAFTPYLFAFGLQQTAISVALYRARQDLSMIGSALAGFFSVAASLLLLWQGASITQLLFVQSLWGFFTAGFIYWLLPKSLPLNQTERGWVWLELFQSSWPYAIVFAAMTMWNRVDQIVASHYLGLESGGQYALASRLVGIPVLIAASVAFSVFPDMQRIGRDAPEKIPVYVGAVLKILFRFGLPISLLLLTTIAIIILPILPKFESAVQLLPWFSVGVWAYWMHSFAINAFWGLRKFREIVIAHLLAIGIYLVSIIPLVNYLGNRGAVLAFNLFGITLLLFALRFMKKKAALPKEFRLYGSFTPAERELCHLIQDKLLRKLRLKS